MGKDTKFFYKKKAWKNTRDAYLSSVGGLCEVCLSRGLYEPAEIVHHRIHINADNVDNPDVTLSWSNLQALCRQCHAEAHDDYYRTKRNTKRYSVDECGCVFSNDAPPGAT